MLGGVPVVVGIVVVGVVVVVEVVGVVGVVVVGPVVPLSAWATVAAPREFREAPPTAAVSMTPVVVAIATSAPATTRAALPQGLPRARRVRARIHSQPRTEG